MQRRGETTKISPNARMLEFSPLNLIFNIDNDSRAQGSRVAAGLPTGYSVLGVTLPGIVASSIGLDWIIGEVNDTQRGLYWK